MTCGECHDSCLACTGPGVRSCTNLACFTEEQPFI